jgi:VPDSG-CTERM motif
MGKIKYIAALLIAVACVGLQQAKADLVSNTVTQGNPTIVKTVPTVPDGGTTVLLLGVALGALGMVRRYLSS